MRKTEFNSLIKALTKELPGFAVKGSLMFIPPCRHLLRGIYFETSAADKRSFYVTVFVLPLFVPTDHIYLNLGEAHCRKRDRQLGKPDQGNEEPTGFGAAD